MASAKRKPEADSAVFDRLGLEHNTMHDQRLAAEVLGLFLAQLPATLQLLDEAATIAEWKFAAHTLKGSCAAVGAQKLQNLAA
jgi:HPt (histidine-containing phosphotransfer) domain-containing protein